MSKKAEIFRFGTDGIPKGLEKRLKIPLHIKQEKCHPLKPYVSDNIIPTDLDIILLEDLNGFYRKSINPDFSDIFLSFIGGIYLAENHVWSDKKIYEKINKALKKEYGIQVKRALLLPQEQISYWSIIHEALHDVFNNLPSEKREKIIQSAIKTYDNADKLYNMLELTHLNISSFDWDFEETERRMNQNKKEKRSLLDGFDDFYTLGNLKTIDNLQAVDEFISCFFANDRVENRWDKKYLPKSFKKTLKEIGYNMDNPPERAEKHHLKLF